MRLKSLEIKGFKSFANETILNFNENVIGIVGPNGSGKSNIVDAVRWVLGEQRSRELRLERMGDVLFNGSKTRKKSPVAQVSLIFDNTKNIIPVEYQSVKISRILYRNGDSEYRLNDIPCRLKDVTNLFIDTGIGSNSYAIIALGMVDDILSDKDNARRRMFEQASGVAKFKIRKKETLNKLKITTTDLERVQDLLFEIEGNLKQLEKQARRAKKYKKYKDSYRQLSIQLALNKIRNIDESRTALEKQITHQKEEYASVTQGLRKDEAVLEKEKTNNITSEQELSSAQKELNDLVIFIQDLENKKGITTNKISFGKKKITELEERIKKRREEIVELQRQVDTANNSLKIEEKSVEKKRAEFNEEKESYEKLRSGFEEIKTLVDQESLQKQSLLSRKAEYEKLIAISDSQLETANLNLKSFQSKLKDNANLLLKLNESKKLISKALQNENLLLTKLNVREEKARQKISNKKDALQLLKDELVHVNRRLDAKKNELALLKSMVENLEGFPESVKYLHQNWNKEAVLLSDILDSSEHCKAALESYLHSYLNYYIVDDVGSARKALAMLTEAQKGKASFFILDRIEAVKEFPSIFKQLESALEHIRVDLKYRPLVRMLLHDVYLTDLSLDEVSQDDEFRNLTILSKNGDFIVKNDTISGGSVGLFEGHRLGRKKNLEDLEQEIQALLKKQEKIIQLIQNGEKAINDASQTVEEGEKNQLIEKIKKIQMEELQVKLDVQNSERRNMELNTQSKQIENSISNHSSSKAEAIKQIEDLLKELETLEKSSGSRTDFNALTKELSEATEQFNKINIEFIKLENGVEVHKNENKYKAQKLNELIKSRDYDQEAVKEENESLEKCVTEIKDLDIELEKSYKKKSGKEQSLTQQEQKYYKARNKINELEDQLRKRARQQNDVQSLINQLKEKFTSVKFQSDSIYERLNIEFGLKKNEVKDIPNEGEFSVEELESKKESIQYKIHNFGEVNPLAIEAYEEITSRYVNIKTQRDDILEAKVSLEATIKEIEITAGKKFMVAFNQIRENFQQIFRTLFTEDDNCDLLLLDDGDPLESDIEIIAKPKGKKPKSISLLSGGEKTLTATALLFALYLLKPAPFCIFDEVDAPLDDANIQKFNKIINKFSKDSQFVIVTHNKSTMAEVDVLYGVYMQEPGISGVSAVDFRTYEHEALLEEIQK
jgi:chromosome segregation protein